jgi:hypothetical protein
MLLISMTDAVVASSSNPRRSIMDRNTTNARHSPTAPDAHVRELTDDELDVVAGAITFPYGTLVVQYHVQEQTGKVGD